MDPGEGQNVQVDLHNHKTGLRDRIEGDNMITNAMNYVIPNLIGAGISASEIMPLCQRVLGGIMLFDGKLTEDKNNIFFPSEAHLVASAGRDTNTEYADRGSLNYAESYETDTGFQSVWDFSTSQANGTILYNGSSKILKRLCQSINSLSGDLKDISENSVKKDDCVNNCTSAATDVPLAAAQGKALQEQIDAIKEQLNIT